jgi:hopanoid biosynthesis associated protein HpnK
MVGAPETADAVARARRQPKLAVGLHLVVVRGRPILPPEQIPDLVDDDGMFDRNLTRAGVRYFFSPRARRQLAAEIRVQFDSFARTGLALDHVNAHNHMHLHPTVLSQIIGIGEEFGLRAVRVPYEPPGSIFLGPWIALMKARLRAAGIRHNDAVFGLRDTGRMDRDHVLPALAGLPDGASEMYFHPATGRWDGVEPEAASFRFEDEYRALIDPAVRDAVTESGARLIAFRDL